MQIEVKMKIKTTCKVQEKTITVVIEKQHEFSKLELEILKSLFVNGYYETKFVNECHSEAQIEWDAMYLLRELDLAEEDEWAWKHKINAKNKYVIEQILEAGNVK